MSDYPVVTQNLYMDYGRTCTMLGKELAVDDITMAVPAGACFGLFGVNGAGKTTVFQILGGKLMAWSGSAHLNGYNVIALARQVRVESLNLPVVNRVSLCLKYRYHSKCYFSIPSKYNNSKWII